MSIALNLLGDVRWRKRAVVGDRPRALLAALAARAGRPVPADELIELVWGEEPPVNGPKSLQVLVSRTRSACGAESIVRDGAGYRLGAGPGEVDSVRLSQLVHDAATALDRDAARAAELALDRPVRRGVRYDATALVGRDHDLDRLRALTASSRVVSIVGAGGLGKTRLAQAIARDAAVPAVHVAELAGVSSAEDVVGEVGSVLGVRDSIQGRRALTAEQRTDARARIAQRLAQAPGLLVLDNCEHLIDAVAELVAFLVSAMPDLHVLTTSARRVLTSPLAETLAAVVIVMLPYADRINACRNRRSARFHRPHIAVS